MNTATKITLLLGAFSAMAFSNALVPVLAEIAPDASVQGLLYAAYFFGAFATVFPVGWLSDKTGRAPLLKIGLFGTFASAILLFLVYPNLTMSVVFRALEGIFTGVFAAAAFSYVNSQENHLKLSGIYIALMNIGMVAGLVIQDFLHSFIRMRVFCSSECFPEFRQLPLSSLRIRMKQKRSFPQERLCLLQSIISGCGLEFLCSRE